MIELSKPTPPARSAAASVPKSREETARIDLPLNVVERTPIGSWKTHGSRLLKPLLMLALLVAAGASAWFFRADLLRFLPLEPKAPVVAVDPGPPRIHALGRLEPSGETIAISAPSGTNDARIEKLNVAEGDRVEENGILATLDNERRLLAAKRLAENRVTQTKALRAQARVVVDSTKASLEASLRSAEADQAIAKLNNERRLRLAQTASITKEEIDQSRLSLQQANEKVRELQANLLRYASQENGEAIDLTVAQRDVEVAEASLEQAIADLDQAYVRAPVAGVVLHILVRPGERIGQSSLLEMGATDQMYARVEVYESDVQAIHVDQGVTLRAKALRTELHGTVERIASYVKRQTVVDPDPAANTDARVVDVMVRLDSDSSALGSRFVALQVEAEFQP